MTDRTLKQMLPVKLSDDERAARAQELVGTLKEYDDVEHQKKSSTSHLTAQMKSLRARATDIRRIVETGQEPRLVDCYEEPNVVGRVWETYRTDTSERVSTRSMTAAELLDLQQPSMFDQGQADANVGAGKTPKSRSPKNRKRNGKPLEEADPTASASDMEAAGLGEGMSSAVDEAAPEIADDEGGPDAS